MTRPPVVGGRLRRAATLAALLSAWATPAAHAQSPQVAWAELPDLSLAELAEVPVTSVTGRPQALQRSAASVYVISGEDIRRSTATSLPEALRLAPNLQVARLNATQYAISARGFNNSIGNKLLVLIDGRTVYSPLYSGVFWDQQEVMLEDIDRIEVISGPGATLWGANAVNGVINVITRPASETQGLRLSGTVGEAGDQANARQGGRLNATSAYRVYARHVEARATEGAQGQDLGDALGKDQAGFRADWEDEARSATVQGDLYQGSGRTLSLTSPRMKGANLLGRYAGTGRDGSTWQLQGYVDATDRRDGIFFNDHTETVDVQFNHAPALSARHTVLWGVGHRVARSDAEGSALVLFSPQRRTLRWSHVFVQDEFALSSKLRLSGGVKVERNVYTGSEFLPTARAAYDISANRMVWAAWSRAVRAPARLDRDFYFPATVPYAIQGGPNFVSEVAKVTELGYRGQHGDDLNVSVTAFHHRYERLRAGTAAPTEVLNLAHGTVHGIEAWGHLDVRPGWRLSAGWVELRESLAAEPQAGAGSVSNLGNDPHHQATLRSTASIGRRAEVDATLRHVSRLPDPMVPGYMVADLRVGWKFGPDITASLLAQNITDRQHVEFDPAQAARWGRALFLQVQFRLP